MFYKKQTKHKKKKKYEWKQLCVLQYDDESQSSCMPTTIIHCMAYATATATVIMTLKYYCWMIDSF